MPSCQITHLRCCPLWSQFAWSHGGNLAPCCTGGFPGPSAHPWCLWAASAHAVLPEIKPPEKLYTSITKFCHFCSKICFSFSQGSSAGSCREALGGPAGTHHSGSPHWKPWSQTTSCDQELILILCVSVASSLWTFPAPSAPPKWQEQLLSC